MRTPLFLVSRPSSLAAALVLASGLIACSNDNNGFTDLGGSDATVDATNDALSLPPPSSEDSGNTTGDDDSGNTTGDDDSGNTTGDDDSGTTGDDGGSTGDDGGAIDAGHDAGTPDCGSPVTFHPHDGGEGPYCPFSSTDGGKDLTCAPGQHCCEPPPVGTSTCATDCSGAPDGGTDWQCDDALDCPTGNVCCAITSGIGQDPGCSSVFLHLFKGTVCATACTAGTQLQVCERAGDCVSGTCTPTRAKGADFGTCD